MPQDRHNAGVEADRLKLLRSALERAHRQSTTTGGWPEHLPDAEQDAWMAMTEIEAFLTGSAGTRLAGGTIDHRPVRESMRRLNSPEVRLWPPTEVANWITIARLLLE